MRGVACRHPCSVGLVPLALHPRHQGPDRWPTCRSISAPVTAKSRSNFVATTWWLTPTRVAPDDRLIMNFIYPAAVSAQLPHRRIPKGWPRDRKRRHHIGVYALTVPKEWRVGRATFWPAGRLRRRLEAIIRRRAAVHSDQKHLEWELANLDDELAEVRWASASAVGLDMAEARESVRDAVGLLRLFQRSLTTMNLDHQTFGLEPEVSHSVLHHFSMSKGRIVLSGTSSAGIPAIGWEFTAEQMEGFASLPEFRYLDRALRSEGKDDLQKRTTTALRFLNLATAMLPDAVRVVLVATALEELLADLQRADRRTVAARRAAYLSCGREFNDAYGPGGRPGCLFIASKRTAEVKAKRAAVIDRGDEAPFCSWYSEVLDLFDTRDLVLHERLDKLRKAAGVNFEAQVDESIRNLAAWAERSRSTTIADLDAEIDAYVSADYRDWPTKPPTAAG